MRPLVFITGASSGIGQALALRYHQAGWRLALVARRVADMQAWLNDQGISAEEARCYGADVSDANSIIDAAKACMAVQGVPTVVIANAGISIGMDTQVREDLEVMRKVMQTNVMGMAATFHPFLEAMKAQAANPTSPQKAGTLVGIASVAGIRGMPGHAAYCASKAAAISYCESLRGELKSQGLRVVTLAPGYIQTPLTQKNKFPMPFLTAFLKISPESTAPTIEVLCRVLAKKARHEKSPACRASFLTHTVRCECAGIASD
jgi:NAD(P)-dependent dehydrogenase (short-subunit alcohol dehydrogenase family)